MRIGADIVLIGHFWGQIKWISMPVYLAVQGLLKWVVDQSILELIQKLSNLEVIPN